ncbi:c-type cytochrome [Pinirhizobacter sp.]|jgi:mono/diheme cytochrome c family protein|uniref:c-type cytochrome n=1 Tax=Pinirhizobacter sp. TaxID=2950432 RepID=UPI002F4276C0
MRILIRVVLVLIVLGVVAGAFMAWNLGRAAALPSQPATSVAAASIITQPIADGPNAEQLRRGQYLVRMGDCLSCHLRPGGEPFAGGLGLNTPFGVIYSSNITSDPTNGIGNWTPEQFYKAMHDGIGGRGQHLYPAFPYPWFRNLERADDDALLAYLKTTKPVAYQPPGNDLIFPMNIRFMVSFWNVLALRDTPKSQAPANAPPDWSRGAILVRGPGHCSACHTPRNLLGADKKGHDLQGGLLDAFFAPDLTGNQRTGLGRWSVDDITQYLKTGRNKLASAGGPMGDVVTYSTSLITDEDRHAIAVYLKSLPASPDAEIAAAEPVAMKRGAAIFSDACTACHLENAVGQPTLFPPLGNNAVAQQNDPTGVLHIILAGMRVGPSPTRPSPLAMPSFAWKLTDQQVADVTTYVRNSWGNKASPVKAGEVAKLRKQLDLVNVRLTDNSGDQP